MTDVKQILESWRKDGIGFVRFELPDLHGISRSKTVPITHASDYAERGKAFPIYGRTFNPTAQQGIQDTVAVKVRP